MKKEIKNELKKVKDITKVQIVKNEFYVDLKRRQDNFINSMKIQNFLTFLKNKCDKFQIIAKIHFYYIEDCIVILDYYN